MIPEPTLRRLPWYLAYLSTLRSQNVDNISTTRIAEDLRVAPSQIAKDLSFLGLKGKTRIGYSPAVSLKRLTVCAGAGIKNFFTCRASTKLSYSLKSAASGACTCASISALS